MLQIVEVKHPTTLRLSEDFLAPYREKGDIFPSLLARSTFLTKYSRGNVETWTDVIKRVVEGNIAQAPGVVRQEAELLFHLLWTGQALPPGRGLWVGGVEGIPADARYNCFYTTLRDISDWTWTTNQLMLGGGVGVGLGDNQTLPVVTPGKARFGVYCRESHPNWDEVQPEGPAFLNGTTPLYRCEDSREGWVEAFRLVLKAAFEGHDQIIDVSDVRPRGEPIRTFGGVSGGPGPLVSLLRSAWEIIRGAQGRHLTSVEKLDVTNHIGKCIKSGNVRRSALIALGDPTDQEFRDAKKDEAAVNSHRHTSNNSIAFRTWDQIHNFDWRALVEDNSDYAEPGFLNFPLIWRTDPGVRGINPCGEIPLEDRGACNLAEVFPAKFRSDMDPAVAFKLITRYTIRQRMTPMLDPEAERVRQETMRLGVAVGGVCDFDYTPDQLSQWYGIVRREADSYADELGVNRPIAVTTIKPSGTISLLTDSSPGAHAPHAPYYIRRVRIALNDAMAQAMIDARVPYQLDEYDSSRQTWVFSFPMKAPHGKISKATQTLRQQFQRQLDLQEYWSDNSVSMTIDFDKATERDEMAALLKEFAPRLKSSSMMATEHCYVQPPYEEIDEATYKEMAAKIDHDSQLVRAGDVDSIQIEACENGVCPVR